MVKVWLMTNTKTDGRLENHRSPEEFITLDELFTKTGVEYFSIDADHYEKDNVLNDLRQKRNYTYEDEITCSKTCMIDFDDKLKKFYREHLHIHEEIRLVLDGAGYFDVRDKEDNWIRIRVEKGDLIIIPAGIYHRFTVDIKNYIKAKRYFVGNPHWLPYNRPADDMDCRKEYIKQRENGFKKQN